MHFRVCKVCGVKKEINRDNFWIDKRNILHSCRTCKECANKIKREKYTPDKARAYRESHKEELKRKKHEYYEANKSEISEKHKNYYRSNVSRFRELSQKWKKNNPDKLRRISRRRYEKIKDHHKVITRRWKQEHKEARNLSWQKRRSKKNQLPSTLTLDQWEYIKKCFDNKCAYCGKRRKLTQDHFVPVQLGGGYTKENIIPCCQSCNSSKSSKLFQEWYPNYCNYSKEREAKITDHIQNEHQVIADSGTSMKGSTQNG